VKIWFKKKTGKSVCVCVCVCGVCLSRAVTTSGSCIVCVHTTIVMGKSPLCTTVESDDKDNSRDVQYGFIYLNHPNTVTGFMWRKLSPLMPV